MSYLLVKNISKTFKDVTALKGISFDIEKGEFVTLLGPSGCGKSTLLRIIAGLESKDSGDIIINGKNLEGVPSNKRNLGMVFQQYSLFPNMTVRENVEFGLKLKKISSAKIKKHVEDILELVGLKEKINNYPDELSGGQQQRVAIARALVMEPDVLLLDEPLSALDAKIRLSLRRQIREIQQKLKITTIFVTHDQEEALSISDRIFVMQEGSIIQAGTPQEIYKNPEKRFVANFVGTYNSIPGALVGNSKGEILVRPEHIRVSDNMQDGYKRARVSNIFFLGNYSRLEIAIENTKMLVDVLNNKIYNYKIGDSIFINIPNDKYVCFDGSNISA